MPSLVRRLLAPQTGHKDWVNFAKGVAILLVILYHCMLFLRSIEIEGGGMGRVKTVLELFPMPIFFIIAGLYHYRVLQWTLAQTWKRKLLGYLYLYILWSVIRFVFYALVPNVRADGAGSTAQDPLALLGILVWPISSYWFVLALFVFTFLVWAAQHVPTWVTLSVSLVLSLVFSSSLITTHNGSWDRMGEYLVFFVVGALYSQRIFAWIRDSAWWWVGVALLAFVALGAVSAFVPGGARIPGVALAGQVAAVLFGVTASKWLVRIRPLGWVGYLGARSLHLYLIHIFVIAALAALVSVLPWLAQVPGRGMLVLAAMMILVTLASVLLGRLTSKVSWLYVPPRFLTSPRRRSRATSTPSARVDPITDPIANPSPSPAERR